MATGEKILYFFLVGLFINEIINKILKRMSLQFLEKEITDRPSPPNTGCKIFDFPPNSAKVDTVHGMPSGHAQSMAFAITFLLCYVFQKEGKSPQFLVKLITLLMMTFMVMGSRIYAGCHSQAQVIVGATIGSLLGVAMFTIYKNKFAN